MKIKSLRADLLLVRLYVRPEQVRGILVPEAYRTEGSRSLWELEEDASPEAAKILGVRAKADDLLITPRNRGTFHETRTDDEEKPYDVYFLDAHHVSRVIPWTSGDQMIPLNDQVLVVLDNEEKKERLSEGGLVLPADTRASDSWTRTGVVEAVGPEVKETQIVADVRVLFTKAVGTMTEENGVEKLLLREADILAIV